MDNVHVPEIAAKVAEHLPGFSLQTTVDSWTYRATIENEDGRVLFLRAEGNRIAISGEFPRDPVDGYVANWVLEWDERNKPGNGLHQITLNAGRSPEVIAREIERRLLPAYTKVFDKVVVYLAERQKDLANSNILAKRVAEWFGGMIPDNGRNANTPIVYLGAGGRIEVGSGRITLDRVHVTPEQAEKIAAVLNEPSTQEK